MIKTKKVMFLDLMVSIGNGDLDVPTVYVPGGVITYGNVRILDFSNT